MNVMRCSYFMHIIFYYRLQSTKKVKPQRKKAGSKNPMKQLMKREDLQKEYTEVHNDVAEKEMKRIKKEQGKNYCLCIFSVYNLSSLILCIGISLQLRGPLFLHKRLSLV